MNDMLKVIRRHRAASAAAALVALVLLVAVVVHVVTQAQKQTAPPPRPPAQLAIFDASPPDSPNALAALKFAKHGCFTTVINYSAVNAYGGPAGAPNTSDAYLRSAESIGVKVIPSIHFLLGPNDLDPDNQKWHLQFGTTTTVQAANIVRQMGPYPAVDGFLITDELPEPEPGKGIDVWLPILKQQYAQLRALTPKRLMAVFYWPGSAGFFMTVELPGQDLMVDYYPYPDDVQGQSFGPIGAIPGIAAAVAAAAGDRSWFVLQGFSWTKEPGTAVKFGFGDNPPAPPAGVIIRMGELALQGKVRNLAIFDYPWIAGTPQEEEVAKAGCALRAELH
jgi:hypothetical protein